jgi:hypothetical protein
MAAAQVDHLRPKIELSRGSRHIETIGAQNLLWPSVYCISYSVGSSPRAIPPAAPLGLQS